MKKKHVALITIMTALSITACGGAKETDTTTEVQQPQAAVEVTADVAENQKADGATEMAETEPTEATETEASVSADSRLSVKIIGRCPDFRNGSDVIVFSFTNRSDENITAYAEAIGEILEVDVACMYDPIFRPGETDYGIMYTSSEEQLNFMTEDDICAALDKVCEDAMEDETSDLVLTSKTYTSDEFSDAVDFWYDEFKHNSSSDIFMVLHYQNDVLVGITEGLTIEGNVRENGFNNVFDADKIELCLYEPVSIAE